MTNDRTVIVTGGSQGIGPALVQGFVDRGYSVVATLRNISKADFAPSRNLMLVDGDINQAATAQKVAHTAISKFGTALITCTAKLRRAFREMTEARATTARNSFQRLIGSALLK